MTRAHAEDWSDKGVYQTLRLVLLRRKAGKVGPIYLVRPRVQNAAGRPVALRINEWKAIVDDFAIAKMGEYRHASHRRAVPWPPMHRAINDALSDPGSPLFRLAGQAYFATTAADQKRPLDRLKTKSRIGDNESRAQAKRIRKGAPHVKKKIGPLEILGITKGRKGKGLIQYRAEHTLLWIFIRNELLAADCDFDATDWQSTARLKRAITGLLDAIPWLDEGEYHLSAGQIMSGVRDPRIADKETVREFGLPSVAALRTLLSKNKPYRPSA